MNSHLSKNPSDYIFTICEMDAEVFACITPRQYFLANNAMNDHHIAIEPKNWFQEMEGCFFCELEDLTQEEMHNNLISQGFEFSEELAGFLVSLGNNCYYPAKQVPPTGIKLDTAALKQFCADYFKNNPGVLVSEYTPVDAKEMDLWSLELKLSTPKAWKRNSKTKDIFYEYPPGSKNSTTIPCWCREFYVKDFALLEKHGYYDEDSVKMYVTTDEKDTRILSYSLECH